MSIIHDGTHKFGSIDLTIGGAIYVSENFATTAGSNVIEITDSLGLPDGAKIIPGVITGSATLQYATDETATPEVGEEFTAETVVYIITEAGEARSQGEISKCNISFRSKINTGGVT